MKACIKASSFRIEVRCAAVRPEMVETPPSMALVAACSKLRRSSQRQPRKLKKLARKRTQKFGAKRAGRGAVRRTRLLVPTLPILGSSKGATMFDSRVGGQNE